MVNLDKVSFKCYQCFESNLPFNSLMDFDFNNVIVKGENNSNDGANNSFGNFILNPFDLNQFINVLDDVMRELHDNKLPCYY